MPDLVDDLLGGTPKPDAAASSSVLDELLAGAPEVRSADKALSPTKMGIVDDPALAAPNFTIARASLAPNVQDQIKRYSAHFNQPVSEFGVVGGDIVRWVPEKNVFAKVAPTIGGQTTVGGKILAAIPQSAAAAGPLLPSIVGGAAGTAMGPTGLSVPVAAIAAGLTDWARQALDKVLAGEPAVPFAGADYDLMNMAGQAALAGGGQGIAFGLTKWLTRNPMGIEIYDRVHLANRAEQAKWAALAAEAQARGVTLTTAQKTGLRSLLVKERQLSRWPETADMLYSTRETQWRGQIPQAYADELGNVLDPLRPMTGAQPTLGRETMIQSFRAGADDVVAQALKVQSQQAKVVYGEAYKAHSSLDSPVLRNIWDREVMKDAITEARRIANAKGELMGPIDAELGRFARDAAALGKIDFPKGGVASGLSLKTWDRIKRGLDQIIGTNVDPRTGKLTAYGQAVWSLKKDLTRELDRLTGGPTGLYSKARLAYGESAEIVDQVLDGGVGFIHRMSGPDRVGIVTRVFTGKNVLPEEIARMRVLFVTAGQEKAWNRGLVAHLANVMDDTLKSAGQTGNVPGGLYSRLGRDRLQHDSIIAALGPQKAGSFDKFLNVLHAASRSLPENSATATDLAAMGPAAVSGKLKVVGRLLSPSSYFDAGNQIVGALEALRTPTARIKLADYLLSDRGMEAIREFKVPSKLTQSTIIWAAQILQNAGVIVAGGRTPTDFAPPMLQEPASP